MKLRFRNNSLRLRLNQQEVQRLAAGRVLRERVEFPGNTALAYNLKSEPASEAKAFFTEGNIQIVAPQALVGDWAGSEEIGLYFTLATDNQPLKVAIEKDLECVDGPMEEKDPNAFPRALAEKVC